MRKAAVVFSGGLDSTVLLYEVLYRKLCRQADVLAVSFNYGQRHGKELEFARFTARRLGVPHQTVDISSVGTLLGDSALLGGTAVPHGHYESETMRSTVVPNRNMIMLSIAAGIAMAGECSEIYYGAHSGDHAIYADCRPRFVRKARQAIDAASDGKLRLIAPLLKIDKAAVVKWGAYLGVPFRDTWSCYEGGNLHCGQCGTCVERIEAFQLSGVVDPTEYRCST